MISSPRATAFLRSLFGLGFGRGGIEVFLLCALAFSLTACGAKKDKEAVATQTAAKVNNEELTVHQINFVLQQQRGIPPEQAASAAQQVLERLINQEVAVQKAKEQNIDRESRVIQQIEAAKREIIARAYVEQIGSGVSKPSAEEIKKYYEEKPALFKERRIFQIQEVRVEAKPEQVAELRAKLQAAAGVEDFLAFLKSGGYKFAVNNAMVPAEQMPLSGLDSFAALKDGQSVFNVVPNGAQILVKLGSHSQPIDEAQANSAIEQYLLNERRRKLIEDDLKALRAAAKIQYFGDYAKNAPTAVGAQGEATPVKAP